MKMNVILELYSPKQHNDLIRSWEAKNEHQQYLTHLWPRYIRNNQPESAESTRFFLIKTKENYAGHCWLEAITPDSAKLGIFIAPKYRNQKIGEQAILKLKSIAVNEFNLKSIYLNVRQNNPRAISCYQNCGFEIVRQNLSKNATTGRDVAFEMTLEILQHKLPAGKR